ncbi:MAG: hypothetical protein WBP45_04795 [Daejeonella sp.]
MQKHIPYAEQLSSLAKEQLKIYNKAPDMNCKECVKLHKHPGWVLKVNLPNRMITWNIELKVYTMTCAFIWRKQINSK